MFVQRARHLDERHRIRKRVDGHLMHGAQVIGDKARAIDLTTQWNDAGVVSHRFSHCLFGTIGHRRSDQNVVCASPFRKGDLERPEQRAEKRGAVAAGQFLDFGGLGRRDLREPSSRCPGRDRRAPHSAGRSEIRFPKLGPLLQQSGLPESALGRPPRRVRKRHRGQSGSAAPTNN